MTHDAPFERQFAAYGIRIGVRGLDLERLPALRLLDLHAHLPPGWRDVTGSDAVPDRTYDVNPAGTPDLYRLSTGADTLLESPDLAGILRIFAAHAEQVIAEHSPDYLFIHAGVVLWRGALIVLPGHSHAGKTTLVRALLEDGATYYSDEYAVVDRTGRVHPYARPLSVRVGPFGPCWPQSPEHIGAPVGTAPVPADLIVDTTYVPRAAWKPRSLSAAHTLLALMRHTVAARGNPGYSMPILTRTVARATGLTGPRGEAQAFVAQLARHVVHVAETGPRWSQGGVDESSPAVI